MDKQKRWQRALIFIVVVLTVYNILPTVFFYAKPLHTSINSTRANAITHSIGKRVNSLETHAQLWLESFCNLVHTKPSSIALDENYPSLIHIIFKNAEEAQRFRTHLPRAGALIPFAPAGLTLYDSPEEHLTNHVTVQRRIPVHFDPKQLDAFFQFTEKWNSDNSPTEEYKKLVYDRVTQVISTLGGESTGAQYVRALHAQPQGTEMDETAFALAQTICNFTKAFPQTTPITARYFASLTQTEEPNKHALVDSTLKALEGALTRVSQQQAELEQEDAKLKSAGSFLDIPKQQQIATLGLKARTLKEAISLIRKNIQSCLSGKSPFSYASAYKMLIASQNTLPFSLEGRNPFVDSIQIDWNQEKIYLNLFADFVHYKKSLESNNQSPLAKEDLERLLYNVIATASRQSGEQITPDKDLFVISLSNLQNSRSLLTLDLGSLARIQAGQIKEIVLNSWNPQSTDLSREAFPIWDYDTYEKLPPHEKKLGLVIYSPALYTQTPNSGFRTNSIYVIAKGWNQIAHKLRSSASTEAWTQFSKDFEALKQLLQKNGLFGYAASLGSFGTDYAQDFIFEAGDHYHAILQATREDFQVHGSQRYAVLEFTNIEQRILTENKIETRIHEDLLKWRDDYRAAQLRIKGSSPFDVPKPTQSALWSNFVLSFKKYFRGDDRKILHWGLDLSGGKTVHIEMRDTTGRLITNETDIKQGINELYQRVNKMGVSEVSLRQEGNYITLDFPGSQNLSAAELVKASSMYFHVVNEKFSQSNSELSSTVQEFLQTVWNEAVVTNRKEIEEINRIAWRHFYGDGGEENPQPRGEAARILYDQGLRLAHTENQASPLFNDTLSKIAKFRGEDFTDWHGQTHPLMFVFHNYALEGSNLDHVQASYDPTKGNFLSFTVLSSKTVKGEKLYPQEDLYAWTSAFSKEKIAGTSNGAFSNDLGWRMAVILNGSIISAPTLDSALQGSAMITGSFSQREVNQLEADLKAGSLSFTPYILSEKNVSPEIGLKERNFGILATIIALVLVIAVMLSYYRFAGAVASIAVLFNLAIIWATLQNLQATLSLASIAGIILTLGMAVDANVLVFERVREEFALTKRIASAMQAGYKKAFSAIFDSNLTTIIAALILLHFDSGPIKAFAITLIIGVVSSMFTALFMTRYFFAGWVQNPKNKELRMQKLIHATRFDFLKWTKPTILFSALIVLLGIVSAVKQKEALLGMDFTGGYALTIQLPQTPEDNYRARVEKALMAAGASSKDFQVRELTPSNHIRLFLSRAMQQPGKPLYQLGEETAYPEVSYPYENQPKIVWVVESLQKGGIILSSDTLQSLATNWTQTSGQISDTMRNQALLGLALALLCIFFYIAFRFEWSYAVSATLCTFHDVIFTIGALALLNILGVPVHIDLNTTVALMTIVGYSLNDTIIVFDRIREDMRGLKKTSLKSVINGALNVTLSRTTLTSGTTLLALIPLILLGGSTIFGFALVMAIGVVFGTLSSLFIAAPLMEYFRTREIKKEQRMLGST